jgi:hypothetical protein
LSKSDNLIISFFLKITLGLLYMSKLAQIPIGGKLFIEVNASPVSGLVASVGSLAVFDNAGVGEFYIKSGSLDTDWSLVGGVVDLTPYFKHDGSVSMTGGIKTSSAIVDLDAVGTNFVALGTSNNVSGADAVVMGRINTASGAASFAMGRRNTASSDYSVVMGSDNTASGNASFAMGAENTASGVKSVAMGYRNTASGINSVAMGRSNTASGFASFAMGNGNTASSDYSVVMGSDNTASGFASVAMGQSNTASGANAVAMGHITTAPSFNQTTIGCGNSPLGGETPDSWVTTDPLFVIGNSSDNGATPSNALVILKDAKSYFKNDMDLGSHQIKNLLDATEPQDAVTLSQIGGFWKYATESTGLNEASTDAYFGTLSGNFDIKIVRDSVQVVNIGANSVTVTTEIVKTKLYGQIGLDIKAESNMIVIAPSIEDGATSLLAQLTTFNSIANRKTKVEIFLSADGVSCSWEKIIHVTQGGLSLTVQDSFYSQDDLGVICSLGFSGIVYSVNISSVTVLNGVNFRVIFTEVCSL